MAITDAEAREAYLAIMEALREQRLTWVTEQVESAIALGKPSRRKLNQSELPERVWHLVEGQIEKRRRGPAPVFVIADEFSAHERLAILIEGVRAAVLHTSEFAAAIEASLPNSMGADFRPELESGEGFSLDGTTDAARHSAIDRLARLLDELSNQDTDAATTRIAF